MPETQDPRHPDIAPDQAWTLLPGSYRLERAQIMSQIADCKLAAGLAIADFDQEERVLREMRRRSRLFGLDCDWVEAFMRAEIRWGREWQLSYIKRQKREMTSGADELDRVLRPRLMRLNTQALQILAVLSLQRVRQVSSANDAGDGDLKPGREDLGGNVAALRVDTLLSV